VRRFEGAMVRGCEGCEPSNRLTIAPSHLRTFEPQCSHVASPTTNLWPCSTLARIGSTRVRRYRPSTAGKSHRTSHLRGAPQRKGWLARQLPLSIVEVDKVLRHIRMAIGLLVLLSIYALDATAAWVMLAAMFGHEVGRRRLRPIDGVSQGTAFPA
jgi:hypothetical protein